MLSLISHNARRNLFWLVTICVSLVFTACSNDDNPSSDSSGGKEYTGIPLIILDTDIGSFTDDLFAMQMLYRYADEGKCKFLGVVDHGVGSTDHFLKFLRSWGRFFYVANQIIGPSFSIV